jgi:hypothetical protein
LQQQGFKTWIDSSGLEYLSSFPNAESRISELEFHDSGTLMNLKHRIHFMNVVPRCESPSGIEIPQ